MTSSGPDFDRILRALEDHEEQTIRAIFRRHRRPKPDADALITGWFRLAEVAHHHALETWFPDSRRSLRLRRPVRRRRDRELQAATKAARRAILAIRELAELLGKHWGIQGFREFQRWVNVTVNRLTTIETQTEQYRQTAQGWPGAVSRRGKARWLLERYMLEVLAAYFQKSGWPVIKSKKSLFTQVAVTVLGTHSLNTTLLRDVADRRLDYDALDAAAPHDVQFAKPPIERKNRGLPT